MKYFFDKIIFYQNFSYIFLKKKKLSYITRIFDWLYNNQSKIISSQITC